MAFTYQYQKAQNLTGEGYVINSAPITTHLIDFAVSYRIKDRWTVNAGLPFISREWKGGPSHNPLNIVPPQYDSEFVDDGHFHGFFQDLRLGASYLLVDQQVIVEPYLEYGIPASDYPFFAASAVGRNLQTLEYGSTFAYRPPFLPWFFSLRAGYVLTDSVLGVDTDAVRVTADAVRFFNDRIALNVFLTSKNGDGISPPQNSGLASELWYRHDQIIRHNYKIDGRRRGLVARRAKRHQFHRSPHGAGRGRVRAPRRVERVVLTPVLAHGPFGHTPATLPSLQARGTDRVRPQ